MTIARAVICAILCVTTWAVAEPYTVKPGDTLTRIAQAELGDSARWREIATLNGLDPPHSIQTGQRLALPGGSADGGPAAEAGAEESVAPMLREVLPELPGQLWLWMAMLLVMLCAITALCLRIACWFSLVETTLGRCTYLALVCAVLLVGCLGVVAGVGYGVVAKAVPASAVYIAGTICGVVYLVAVVLFSKRILQCKWRSVVTVGIMASLVADVLTFGLAAVLMVALPTVLGTEALQNFIDGAMATQSGK